MTALVFVDTNIFVYCRDISEPVKQAAAERWIGELRLVKAGMRPDEEAGQGQGLSRQRWGVLPLPGINTFANP